METLCYTLFAVIHIAAIFHKFRDNLQYHYYSSIYPVAKSSLKGGEEVFLFDNDFHKTVGGKRPSAKIFTNSDLR